MRLVDLFVLIVVFTGLLSATSQAQTIQFDRDIAPILEVRCGHCHGEAEQESGLRFDRRTSMLRGGDSGLPAVVPGKPEKSYLIDVINHVDEDMAMPPDDDKLSPEEIDKLTIWIKQGAIWAGQMEAVERQKSNHWSFQPIKRPQVPNTTHDAPIDAFLLQRIAKEGLSFSPQAGARSLIRRVSVVLTGMPPTSEETIQFLEAFSAQPNQAYEDLVDRLLESPHFGERWAQHWLDVIRWAETNGSESNMFRKNAWIYRDYVIQAFNEDKPYDRFLFEQIAGDTCDRGDATGFLVSGSHVPISTVGQEPAARRQARADRMDEILQTVGASALGVSIGCARCHNHKFDPISIQDYYSMSAVFQDIEFGSRLPELSADHPRNVRGQKLSAEIAQIHDRLKQFGPWEENWLGYKELRLPASIKTKKIRITFDRNKVRLDEIEIFGPDDPRRNLALDEEGTETFSRSSPAYPRSKLEEVNNGNYGTQAWTGKSPAGSNEHPSIEFTFAGLRSIDRVRMSSNREDFFETDYLQDSHKFGFDGYRIDVEDENGEWKQVAVVDETRQFDEKFPERTDLTNRLKELIQQINNEGPKHSFVARFIKPRKTHVLGRGSPENPRDEVFPAGLFELDGNLDLEPYSPGPERRKAFANWMCRPNHPLTARVAANRLWHHVFGRGIVATTSDFGAAGATPTHPELLNWLAAELMSPTATDGSSPQPWSMKHLIRLMVMSKGFRQSSFPRDEGLAVDTDSTLLWRFPPKRVEAEVIRDTILQASGSLDRGVGGRSYRIHNIKTRYAQWEVVDNYGHQTWRRMIYQERMRRVDDQLFTAFDFPDCGQIRAKRPVSTTPLQALNLMNSQFVLDQSRRIAERATLESEGDESRSIDRCFELVLGRLPEEQERRQCLALAKENDLSLVCRALINSNEFAFLQ